MTVEDAIKARCSVRRYSDRAVEDEKVHQVLEAGRLAPSASNRQEWRFVVVTDGKKRARLGKAAAGQKFVGTAPCVIACCAETDYHEMKCGQMTYPIDLAIAIDHMTLRAVELGLGTCWIGAFYEDEVKKVLNIPEDIRVVELLPLGYPADKGPADKSPAVKNRHNMEEIVSYDNWGQKR